MELGLTNKVLDEMVKDRIEELAAVQEPTPSSAALDEIALLTSGLDAATVAHLEKTIRKTRSRTAKAVGLTTEEFWEEITEDIEEREEKRGIGSRIAMASKPEWTEGTETPQRTHLGTVNKMIQELRRQAYIPMDEGEQTSA